MLHCSFCRKSEAQVARLVDGPNVYICDECVVIAMRLMRERPSLLKRLWRVVKDLFRNSRMAECSRGL